MAGRLWSTGVVALAAVGLGVVGAVPSGATAPGANGMVAFAAYDQILTARQVGGETVFRFLTTSGDNRRPRWSQDGTRLVFYTRQGAIKTVNADGSGTRTVVGSGGSQPTWQSPSRIAFVKTVGGKGDIYSVAATGGALTRLTKDGAATCGNLHPAFSYDGRYLAYVQQRPIAGSCEGETTTVLKVVDRATGAIRVVSKVSWSAYGDPPQDLPVAARWDDRVDFDASGRRVMFSAGDYQSNPYCTQVWAVLDVRDGSYTFSTYDAACDPWGTPRSLAQNAPLPDGRFAVDVYDTHLFGSDMDVQPVTS